MIDKTASAVLAMPRPLKRAVAIASDVALCVLTTWLAFGLRIDTWGLLSDIQWLAVLGSVILAIPIFAFAGLYQVIFRYSGWPALNAVVRAVALYGVIYATIFTLVAIPSIPRTVGIIQPVLLFLFVSISRILASYSLGGAYKQLLRSRQRHNVMIYGAGSAGRQLSHALGPSELRVVGFIDDDERLHGRLLNGCPVYSPAKLGSLIVRKSLTDVLLAIPSAGRQRRKEILEMLRPLPVAVRTLPGLTDLAQGRVQTSDLRDLDVDDLLGREAVEPDQTLIERKIKGKIVLVSGAGGSIGSELCRQIIAAKPDTLLLIEASEVALYSAHQELAERAERDGIELRLVPLLGSVCDAGRMESILAVWKPHTIYHAAAYKHVPIVEHNPAEGVSNNVFGTLTLATAAKEAGVADFVFISTDKAVRPTNVMGTSKRLAELVLQALAEQSDGTCFSMVRFGNVLGSSGSVVPLFRQQIHNGGPITITHEEITRYFMTIPEAAQLVIQAGAMARGGEVFVLDMGDPVRIVDLAKTMIELSGLKVRSSSQPDGDIEISVVGLRPGEKLYEELLIGDNPEGTDHPRIMKANEKLLPWSELQWQLALIKRSMDSGDVAEMLRLLRQLIPEYQPEGDVVDWVHLEQKAS